MDRYREINGSPSDCESHKYRRLIFQLGLPEVDMNSTSIRDLQYLERATFYPPTVTRIFNRSRVDDILSCRCDYCKATRRTTSTEIQARTDAVLDEQRPCKMLLAILIYLGRADLIHDFIRGNVTDVSSHPGVRQVLRDQYGGSHGRLGSQQTVDQFCDKFEEVLALFRPEHFTLNSPSHNYIRNCRFPFLNDQYHASGSFGKVRKFNIHPDFLDEEIKQSSWYKESGNVCASYNSPYQAMNAKSHKG